MRSFKDVYATAVLHKGGEGNVESSLPINCSESELRLKSNSYYLSAMSRRIFRAGLRHSMVDAKWPAFEEVFKSFEPMVVAMMSDEDLEKLMHDARIIRHFGKIRSVRGNAIWMLDVIREFGSFGNMIADWPSNNIIDLWAFLKKNGTQMGGQSGPSFLRMVGKDTMLLTDDVVSVLKAEGVVEKIPTSQKDLRKVQDVFNLWKQESGRALSEISRITSFTANAQ
jgi:3-methyladenine DNA glycosylase Tag